MNRGTLLSRLNILWNTAVPSISEVNCLRLSSMEVFSVSESWLSLSECWLSWSEWRLSFSTSSASDPGEEPVKEPDVSEFELTFGISVLDNDSFWIGDEIFLHGCWITPLEFDFVKTVQEFDGVGTDFLRFLEFDRFSFNLKLLLFLTGCTAFVAEQLKGIQVTDFEPDIEASKSIVGDRCHGLLEWDTGDMRPGVISSEEEDEDSCLWPARRKTLCCLKRAVNVIKWVRFFTT